MSDRRQARFRRFGAALQGLVLGALTFLALWGLVQESSLAQVFRYQGF